VAPSGCRHEEALINTTTNSRIGVSLDVSQALRIREDVLYSVTAPGFAGRNGASSLAGGACGAVLDQGLGCPSTWPYRVMASRSSSGGGR
jgi:hypothetical protein